MYIHLCSYNEFVELLLLNASFWFLDLNALIQNSISKYNKLIKTTENQIAEQKGI